MKKYQVYIITKTLKLVIIEAENEGEARMRGHVINSKTADVDVTHEVELSPEVYHVVETA
jgi:hypothetical protein